MKLKDNKAEMVFLIVLTTGLATGTTLISGDTQPDGYELNVTTLSPQDIQPTEADLRANITAKDKIYDAALVYWNITNTNTGKTKVAAAEISENERIVTGLASNLNADTGYDFEAYINPIVDGDRKLTDTAAKKAVQTPKTAQKLAKRSSEGAAAISLQLHRDDETQKNFIKAIDDNEIEGLDYPNLDIRITNKFNTDEDIFVNNIGGLEFNEDGTKVYVTDEFENNIYSYSLTEPFDLSTATYTGNKLNTFDDLSNTFTQIKGMAFNNNGTKVILASDDYNNKRIFSLKLSEPYDITTASYTGKNITPSSAHDELNNVGFNDDGTILYTNDEYDLYSYKLSTPYDISSATYTGNRLDFEDNSVDGFGFNKDGTKLFEAGDRFSSWELNEAYNITTATSTGAKIYEFPGRYIEFNKDGTKLYATDYDKNIRTYELNNPYSLEKNFQAKERFDPESDYARGLEFNKNGTKLFDIGTGEEIHSYTLNEPYNLTTASYTGNQITTQGSRSKGIVFNENGTKMYEINRYGEIYSYSLTNPYDLTTASYNGNKLNTYDKYPQAMEFYDDGEKMYVVGSDDESLNVYKLSKPYDITEAKYQQSYFNIDYTDGMAINNDGTKLFFADSSYITSRKLSEPFNLETAQSPSDEMNLDVRDIHFSNDGTRLFTIDNDYDINSYERVK